MRRGKGGEMAHRKTAAESGDRCASGANSLNPHLTQTGLK
jgi:hypothetical protein